MSVPRSLGFFLLMVIGCFSVTQALLLLPSINSMLHGPEVMLMRKISALKNAYEEAKEKFGDELPEQEAEVNMNASQLITSKGYPCERHLVLTDDGFILELQRIPYGIKGEKTNKTRPVAYLQHGLLGSSTNFLTNLANESLAFVLADAGYDVWLGNSRGNTYSCKHLSYLKSMEKFWSWSFDEMAKYDLPATLNYITKYTREEQLYYIGHSQGTLIGFLAFSENKELAKKIRLMLALGPVFTVGHMTSPVKVTTMFTDQELFYLFGRKGFLPDSKYIHFMAKTICKNAETRFLCLDVIQLIAGFDHTHLNVSRLPVYLTHCPSGTSTQNMDHFAQLYRTKTCSKYDFGSKEKNQLHYGQPTPPKYDVSKMEVPVALYSGGKDTLADPKDVQLLAKQLKNLVVHKCIEEWAHLEFIWGTNGPDVLFKPMMKLMEKF